MMTVPGAYHRASSAVPQGGHQPPRTPPVIPSNVVCKFWAQGRCSRRPCPFLHAATPPRPFDGAAIRRRRPSQESKDLRGGRRSPPAGRNLVWKNPNAAPRPLPATATSPPPAKKTKRDEEKTTDAKGCISPLKCSSEEKKKPPAASDAADAALDRPSCSLMSTASLPPPLADGCSSPPKKTKSSHEEKETESPVVSDCNSDEAAPPLSGKCTGSLCGGHTGKITGIAMSKVVDKFFTSCDGGKICVWKSLGDGRREQTPEQVIQLRSPISCLIAEGICVFAGARGGVHVCNVLSKAGLFLPIPDGRVTSLAAGNEALFAGVDDGSILAWKMVANHHDVEFQPAVCLRGHASAVTCLAVRGVDLFSGGRDGSIRAWNVASLEAAAQELDVPPAAAHEGEATSLVFWRDYLLSASLDGRIKAWAGEYGGVENALVGLRQIYVHHERRGILFLGAADDGAGGPILLCSLLGSTVQLYHLPTFLERGVIQCPTQAVAVHAVPSGVFVGEAAGEVSCWSFSAED